MKANDLLQENPNLHLTHLEDLALFQGKAGAIRAVAFLRNLANLAKTSSTKFLVITHHRMTMARVNRLFGVTMPEQGVSQLVSVDLEKAVEIREQDSE